MNAATAFVPARVRSVADVATTVREVDLVPDDGPGPFSPGSHVDLALEVGGLPVVRSYSVVGSGPVDGAYRIAVRLVPDSRGGSARVHGLAPGDRLEITHPVNHFELTPRRAGYLLVAGGIGVTALVGMAEALAERGAPVHLAYAGRSSDTMPYVEHLRAVLGPAAVQLAVGDRGERLDLDDLFASLHPDGEAYVCGPPSLLDAARDAWRAAGRPGGRLRFETFGSAGRHATEAFEVEVRDHGDLVVPVPRHRTLLAALDAAGVEVVHDCLRGECGLCTVTVLPSPDRPVVDHRDVFLDEDEKARSERLCACVSRAVGGRIAIDTGFRR